MVQRGTGTQYMLLANNLLQKIRDGVYAPGELLPSEAALCTQFSISRITAQSALRHLEAQGIVSRRRGIGTRVELSRPQPVFTHAGGSVDDVVHFTRNIPLKVLSRTELTVSGALAAELTLPVEQRFALIRGVRLHPDEGKLSLSTHYVPALLAPTDTQLRKLRGSLAQYIADLHGDEIQTIRQKIGACLLSKTDAEVLDRKPRSAAVISKRWYSGRQDRLLLVSVSVFPAEQYSFDSTLRRSGSESKS